MVRPAQPGNKTGRAPTGSRREADSLGQKVETYVDVRKLLENKNVDAVTVATPDHWHVLVTVWACQVIRHGGWHLMFYIGFRDEQHAQIGLARSRDGITGWQRHRSNPIIAPTRGQWDQDACYKPFAILDRGRWLLWYNGRRGSVEQIGLAVHEGEDLGF